MDHLQRFFVVTSVLLRYLIEKLKTFFGRLYCTIDQRLRVLELARVRMQDMINRYDLGSSVIRLFFCPFEWQSELALRSCTGHIECYNKNLIFATLNFCQS